MRGTMGRQKSLITFECEYCGEVTELHGPGQIPHFCEKHRREAKANMSKMRMRAMRERQKAAATSPSAPGSKVRRSR
jgi:hypothetical protein